MIKILFLCTGNSCRSQMAEGWCNHFHKGNIRAFSAGIAPEGEVNKYAIKAMSEVDIDISNHRSQHLNEFKNIDFDFVITVCDTAKEKCPLYWGKAKKIHKNFEDPLVLAKKSNNSAYGAIIKCRKVYERPKTEEEVLKHYRRIRDELKEFVLNLPEVFKKSV